MHKTLFQALDRMEQAMKWIAAACLLSMALVTGADVAASALFNSPIFGAEEIVAVLAVLTTGFAMPFAHNQRSHIGVEFFTQTLSRTNRRRLRFLTDLAALGLFGVVAWQMFLYSGDLEGSGQVTMNLEIPTWAIVLALAVAFSAFALCVAKDALTFFLKDER